MARAGLPEKARRSREGRLDVLETGQNVPYTTILPANQLLGTFLHRVRQAANTTNDGDRIIVAVCAHGANCGEAVIGNDFLSKPDLLPALESTKSGARVSIVNSICQLPFVANILSEDRPQSTAQGFREAVTKWRQSKLSEYQSAKESKKAAKKAERAWRKQKEENQQEGFNQGEIFMVDNAATEIEAGKRDLELAKKQVERTEKDEEEKGVVQARKK
ncbi:hypothetical protein K440DRAFT_658859 [Wilcoxina mikolae CBS 423.85]|nr:hypothetical protein K440DRAFT_658859 [Wilcoxina mikolae CBS 423.85]